MTTTGRWHIGSSSVDQVFYTGTAWSVVDPSGAERYSAGYLGRARCRLWGLLHGHGWLPVAG